MNFTVTHVFSAATAWMRCGIVIEYRGDDAEMMLHNEVVAQHERDCPICNGTVVPEYVPPCRVYWGSHGCDLPRGHEGPHRCDCADNPDVDPVTRLDPEGVLNVGAWPYYGEDTNFYGEDAEALGLRTHKNPNGKRVQP